MPTQEITITTDLCQVDNAPTQDFDDIPPPADRAKLFSFSTGDIDDDDWDDFLDRIDPDVDDPQPEDNSFWFEDGDVNGLAEPNTYLNAVINYEVPKVVGGRILAGVDTDSHNARNLLRARVPNSLQSQWYLYPRTIYRFDLEFEMLNDGNWQDSVNWAIFFEIWGTYSSSWTPNNNPPFAFGVDRDSYASLTAEVQLYGAASPDASAWEYDEKFTKAISPSGSHTLVVWWKKDHLGRDSRCKVVLDGTTMCDVTNKKLGTPFDVDGNVPANSEDATGGIPQFGVYTPRNPGFASPGVQCYFDKFEISRVDSI